MKISYWAIGFVGLAAAGGVWFANRDPRPTEGARIVSSDPSNATATPAPAPSPTLPPEVAAYCDQPYETTCANGTRPSRDPTGVVHVELASEIRALRVLRKVVAAHPTWTSKQIEEALAKEIYTETRRGRIESAFRWVHEQLGAVVDRQPIGVISVEEKKFLRERLASVRLEMPPPAHVYADAVDILTKNTLYYERTPQGVLRLRVGGAFLMNVSSWFNLVFSLAHEFAHAIDPCELEAAKQLPAAYENLRGCFVENGWMESARAACGPQEQVSEVFADWMAAEVLSAALATVEAKYEPGDRVRAVINSVRDLCEDPTATDTLGFQNHQPPLLRIDRIVGRAPKIRESLGCADVRFPVAYCTFDWAPPARPSSASSVRASPRSSSP